ncbi:MAG: ATP-binding cassette domain-containing protein, partial [Planctomycetes bacterium]|nr:ATP-binding cassette domain-containing protein [Planctomycetota bacterium]
MRTDVDPCVEFDGVWMDFGGEPVLRGISLRVRSGDSLVVIGGSGAGKSVILRLTLGLLRPTRGS